jgi:hypothetical protein
VGRSYATSGNIVRAALVLVPYVSDIADVFDHVQETNQSQLAEPYIFPDTYAGQVQLYGGNKIIRGIYATTESNWLKSPGHFINVAGKVKYNKNTGANWEFAYRYVDYHNL